MCCCGDDLRADNSGIPFDERYLGFMEPWDGEEEPAIDHGSFHYWPNCEVPMEVVSFLEFFIRRSQEDRDLVVIETGVSQGYVTRRLAPLMRPERDLYWCYEPHDAVRQEISIRDFWVDNLSACIKQRPTPDYSEFASADLVISMSSLPWNMAELYLWQAVRKPDSLLITSVGDGEQTSSSLYALGELGDFKEMWTAMFEHSSLSV